MKNRPQIDWYICAAGSGRRFVEKGIAIPKAQIRLKGRSMLERSLLCLPIRAGDRVIIIVQKKTTHKKFEREIESIFPWIEVQWVRLAKQTSGQLSTFLKAKKFFKEKRGIAIWNCDTSFNSSDFEQSLMNGNWDGLVPCGKLTGNNWSFFKTNKHLEVLAAQEKERISPWASVGLYYFKNIRVLYQVAQKIVTSKPNVDLKEHYVSFVYPYLIGQNCKIKVCPTDVFLPFGTPEQVKEFWGTSIRQLIEENTSVES